MTAIISLTCSKIKVPKFTLEYVYMDGRGLKKVVGASICDLGEVIESDHVAIRVEIEWKWVMEEKEIGTKEMVSKQTEMGSVWQADEWEGV